MLDAIKRIFSIEDLRNKILFTLLLLLACRVGAHVPVPGVNPEEVFNLFKFASRGGQNLFQLVDLFSGGAFAQMTIVALGVMPYISASIILQLLIAIVPSLQREVRENPEAGKRKIANWTRWLTLALAMFQACLYTKYALGVNASHPGIVSPLFLKFMPFGTPLLFYMTVMVAMTTGTLILMWIGEQISERGIGNGISLIIAVGIVSSLPSTLGSIVAGLNLDSQDTSKLSFITLIVLAVIFVGIILATILIIQGQRKIPLQYARRIVGRREVQGGSAYLPLKVNYAGVIPVIFASSILMFPATIAQFLDTQHWFATLARLLSPGNWFYMVVYVLLILFFTYFWTATQFNPEHIASDMKKNGAFIPGVRQGKPTQEFLESTMNRITFAGAVFLAMIAILPSLVGKFLDVDASISQFFGGTSLLILVGVVLDTMKQIESHLISKRYDGFMTKKRSKVKI